MGEGRTGPGNNGMVHEKELLEKVVPVDSVSQFIHFSVILIPSLSLSY